MAEITAAMVKALREKTGAGMMDCKKALTEANGDTQEAETILAKRGNKRAAKASSKTAAEGLILADLDAILEVNCQTDFVARDESFKAFADKVLSLVKEHQETNPEKIAELAYDDAQSVEEARQALVARIGENVQIRRAELVKADASQTAGFYVHMGRIGVICLVDQNETSIAREMAMQIAAAKPDFLKPEDVDADRVAKEKEILMAQAADSGKPAEIIEKMIEGRLKKFLNEICLTGQPYIKNPDITVGQYLKEKGVNVVNFTRYEVGEGIEKEVSDFAEEVRSQVQGGN